MHKIVTIFVALVPRDYNEVMVVLSVSFVF